MGQWIDDMEKAYQANDREKMGELIEQMKQRRERSGPPAGGERPEPRGAGGGRAAASGASRSAGNPAADEAEKKILDVLDDMNRNQRWGNMNVPEEDGRLLRILTAAEGAKNVVEIGTSNGYSGIWFCLALRKTGGKLTTHEIDGARASAALENFERAGVSDLVTIVEGNAHETVTKLEGPIDVLFIDADKPGYMDYLTKLKGKVRPGGLIIAHNTDMRGQMADYLEAVTTSPDLETIFLNGGEIGVTLKKR
jgi:predicted O-methyltransferase YrrM